MEKNIIEILSQIYMLLNESKKDEESVYWRVETCVEV